MAKRRKQRGENISGYFRNVFREKPQWLHEKSNDLALARYREDHGIAADTDLDPSVRGNLANIKSKLRREPSATAGPRAMGQPRRAPGRTAQSRAANNRMAALEEQIDECLALAKHLDREGLDPVITLLRRARNEVVWKIGQP